MKTFDYYRECLVDSFSENGIVATPAQIDEVARAVDGAVENRSLAFHVPENPLVGELERTKAQLKIECEKIQCRECSGSGVNITRFGTMEGRSQCWRCHGYGKHSP